MKELTIKFENKEYTTTDEKLYSHCANAFHFEAEGITHSLKTISDYTLNLYMMQIGKKYLCDKSLGIIEMLTDGTLAKSEDKSIFAVSQQDRFKEYVPKMVSKTVERFVSDNCVNEMSKNMEYLHQGCGSFVGKKDDVHQNKIAITFEVED